jgi:hypothetical protein
MGAGFDESGEADLVFGSQEHVFRYLVEIYPDGVGRPRSRCPPRHSW